MEPVTQALLGAATAELVCGKKLRGRALGWGAIIGMSPDLDVLFGPLRDGYGEWLYHRGTTHSLWFGFVMGPLLGWLLWKWRDGGESGNLPGWIKLSIAALVTHPLLDGFTPYGTQLLAPFVRDRFAWNGVAIVDPFYSVVLGLGVAAAAARSLAPETRRRWLLIGLSVSTAYLGMGLAINRWVVSDIRAAVGETAALEANSIERIRAYPTIFQPWLRSFVLRTGDAVYVGLHSWQEAGCPAWQRYIHPPASPALNAVRATWQAEMLEWFADGDVAKFVHSEPGGVTRVRLEDVRYSWASPNGRGMWGLEARVDATGELIGEPVRLARTGPTAGDFDRIGRLLTGALPDETSGWQRPYGCSATDDSTRRSFEREIDSLND